MYTTFIAKFLLFLPKIVLQIYQGIVHEPEKLWLQIYHEDMLVMGSLWKMDFKIRILLANTIVSINRINYIVIQLQSFHFLTNQPFNFLKSKRINDIVKLFFNQIYKCLTKWLNEKFIAWNNTSSIAPHYMNLMLYGSYRMFQFLGISKNWSYIKCLKQYSL